MFMFDRIDASRFAVSAFGAIALTAACVGATVAPARAADLPVSPEAWQTSVERQIAARDDRFATAMESGKSAEAVLAVRFSADGDYAGADIARSSGDAKLDRHAVAVASRIAYPQLPASLRGQPHSIAMRLVFGRADTNNQYLDMTQKVTSVRMASADRASTVIAAR